MPRLTVEADQHVLVLYKETCLESIPMKSSIFPFHNFDGISVLIMLSNILALERRIMQSRSLTGIRRVSSAIWEEGEEHAIKSLCESGRIKDAIGLFRRIVLPKTSTYILLLQSCISMRALTEGRSLHAQIIANLSGRPVERVLANKLINMYGRCGSLDDARRVFDEMPHKDVVSWTAILSCLVSHDCTEESLVIFRRMLHSGVQPNHFTIATLLPAAARIQSLHRGLQLHQQAIKMSAHQDLFVGNALIDMYSKCSRVEFARQVFDEMPHQDIISWTSLIAGYAQNDSPKQALQLFHEMQMFAVRPNIKTFTSVISACADLGDLEQGICIHEQVKNSGLVCDHFVENAIINMYSKCGDIELARQSFDEMPSKSTISWTAIIAGYVQNGHYFEALELYKLMQKDSKCRPDIQTFASILPACGKVGALEQGREIHKDVVGFFLSHHSRCDNSVMFNVWNALIDMYAKCGSLDEACGLFDWMQEKDVVTWTAMIGGYAMHGHGRKALELFQLMQETTEVKPNSVTFLCILAACSHSGLVKEGKSYFESMTRCYYLAPEKEHYSCMVDLLGRNGYLYEAEDFIKKMPVEPDEDIWTSLLSACRVHMNIELAERVAVRLMEMAPHSDSPYILVSNMYATCGKWERIESIRRAMREKGVNKKPGCSWIEVNKAIHSFFAEDHSHPQAHHIYKELQALSMQIKAAGYVPDKTFVLNDVEEEQKEHILSHHSERLAIVFGLINTEPGIVIRVIKNLRICGDCHNAIKFICKVTEREIVVRDTNRYHHFKDGDCSCNDYW